MGLVINRRTDIEPSDMFGDEDAFRFGDYDVFWGGPVGMNSLQALVRSDIVPDGALTILESVHHVPVDEWLYGAPDSTAQLRLFVGYAGWGPGQLDHEMARGSWHVVPAKDEHVFAEDPDSLWDRLKAAPKYQVAVPNLVGDTIGQTESAGH